VTEVYNWKPGSNQVANLRAFVLQSGI